MVAPAIGALATVLGGYFILTQLANTIPPVSRALQQWSNKSWRNELLDLTNIITAFHRRNLSEEQALEELHQYGLSKEKAAILIDNGQTYMTIRDVIELKRKGKIEGQQYEWEMKKAGVYPEDIASWEKAFEPIPTPSDIVLFAVREVYSPDIVKSSGLMEGYETVYENAKKDVEATGLKPEHFAKYWAAHWQYPSPTLGFEMVHRGIIPVKSSYSGELSLDQLLRISDYAPGWRDKMIEATYSPLTRVDIRRMHALGYLNDDQCYQAYKAIGYNDYNAKLLLDFTRGLTAKAREKAEGKDKTLTKADILSGYRDGLIDRVKAYGYLKDIGYSPSLSDYFLLKADKDEKDRILNAEITIIKQLYQKRVITKPDAESRLHVLNVPSKRVREYIDIWTLEERAKYESLSLTKLESLYKSGIIKESEFRTELQALGYPEKYIGWIIDSTRKET